jgi:hypothetical protein
MQVWDLQLCFLKTLSIELLPDEHALDSDFFVTAVPLMEEIGTSDLPIPEFPA